MWGVNTQVYNPKISTACTMSLEKKQDTRGAAPTLLRIRVILLQTPLSRDKFFTAAVQLLSAAKITHTRYLKEFTIPMGRP